MAVKDIVRQVIEKLPDEASMDDVIHALYVIAKFEHGESEIRKGLGVSHEVARQRLQNVYENRLGCVAGVSPARGGGILPPQDGCFFCIPAAETAAGLAGKMPATRSHTRSQKWVK